MMKRMLLMLMAMTAIIAGLGFVKFQQIQTAIAQGASFQPPPEAVTTITAGMAKMIMNEVTTCDHTKRGMRFSDIPGARCLKTFVRVTTAPAKAEISVSVIMSAQTSTR